MKLTVLVVIFTADILEVFGIIVYDGTKEPERRFGLQHAEPSQISEQKIAVSDGTLNGFSSVVVHRPANTAQTEDHSSSGGLTVQDPPEGWPLSEMHISFDPQHKDVDWKSSKDIKVSVLHKEQIPAQQQHPNQVQQAINKPHRLHLEQNAHVVKRQPSQQSQIQPQRYSQEQRYQLQQPQEQEQVYQQTRQQQSLHQNYEKTEVEVHPQVLIKLPEQQEARLLRPLYVQDQPFPQQLSPSVISQEKPFHPSVQISDSNHNPPVQQHTAYIDGFSPMIKKQNVGATRTVDPATQISNNKPKKIFLAPENNEDKHIRGNVKSTRMRHPHATVGGSYSVGFRTPPDAFKNGNQLQHLIIKDHETVAPGKTLLKQKTAKGGEINNDLAIRSKTPQTSTNGVSHEGLKNENYAHQHLQVSSVGLPPVINIPTSVSPEALSSSTSYRQTSTQTLSPQFAFEEAQQFPIGGFYNQKLLSRDLLPPPIRGYSNPEGIGGGHLPLGLFPPREGHSSFPPITPNKIINFVPGGAVNEGHVHTNNLYYSSEAGSASHQNNPSPLPVQHNVINLYSSGNEKGSQASATTGKGLSSGALVSQYHGLQHPVNLGAPSVFHGFLRNGPLYGHGHIPHILENTKQFYHADPHAQIIDTTKHSVFQTPVAAGTQDAKSQTVQGISSQTNYPINYDIQRGSQKLPEKNKVSANFQKGQSQDTPPGKIHYSFAGQGIQGPLTYAQHVDLGTTSGNVPAVGQTSVLQFNKGLPQNIPAYLNINNGVLHLGHPGGQFLYPQQELASQVHGNPVQSFHMSVAGVPHGVYTNNLLGTGVHPTGVPAGFGNVQSSAEVPSNQVHLIPGGGTLAPTQPGIYGGVPITYVGVQQLNTANKDTGHLYHSGGSPAFPGIGNAYPQSAGLPFVGGAGTTFALSQAPLQDYRQQSHVQQMLSIATPQHLNIPHTHVNKPQNQNAKSPQSNVHANTFGAKIPQHHPASQHIPTSHPKMQHKSSNI